MAVARERGTTVLTIGDVERLGIERAAEAALEIASQNTEAILLSLDIDVVDPGTGTPEPGGLSSREMLRFIGIVAREAPLCGMEVVEVSPPYDSGDITSLLACRSIPDVLAVLVAEGKLGRRAR
jgi:arginase family enzyme